MANYLTFDEIHDTIAGAMGDSNQVETNLIKSIINMVYLTEIPNSDDLNPCLYFLMHLIDSIKTKDSKSITGITSASPPVVTSAAHGFEDGDIVQLSGVVGMTEVNNRLFVVDDKAAGTLELQTLDGTDVVGLGYTAYGSGGTIYHRGITLPSGYGNVISAAWHSYSGEMKEIDEHEAEKTTSFYDPGNSGRPSRYFLKKYFSASGGTGAEATRMVWGPIPDQNYQMRMWASKLLDRLSATSDVPLIPYQFHDMLISGALTRLVKYEAVQVYNAVIWPQLYKEHLSALISENRRWWARFNKDNRSAPFLR